MFLLSKFESLMGFMMSITSCTTPGSFFFNIMEEGDAVIILHVKLIREHILVFSVGHFFEFWVISLYINNAIKNNYVYNRLETWVELHGFEWMPDIFLPDGINRCHLSVHYILSE